MLEHIYEIEKEYKKQTVKTNADKIRSMSDEELAEFLDSTVQQSGDNLFSCDERDDCDECKKCYLKWLQSEAE